jgi:tRNA uridine 5-carboxymethylaminomethyl modification enzyme
VLEGFEVIVVGGGHAGVEAAWAAANVLGGTGTVALVTLDPTKIGAMSCNPAIGGLAKGQMVREIDALNGVMGLAADATGIQFKVLNASKGAAVRGPRAQCDKHAYAAAVQGLVAARPEIVVVAGSVEEVLVAGTGTARKVTGVVVRGVDGAERRLAARAVVLTTGTFMRGLMHTGEVRTPGGRVGEGAAVGISGALTRLGFELGRLKTGTPPRLRRGSISWEELEEQRGDEEPVPFSGLSGLGGALGWSGVAGLAGAWPSAARFPLLPQVDCRVTATNAAAHGVIRANLHRAPMYSGQIGSLGPRYCPSIEDKVVRFAERESHHVYLEPESLTDDWVYCNGISTSLPAEVQLKVVRAMKGCERAEVLRYGYAVEYDVVRAHQLCATGMTKPVEGLFLAGQVNGTSGYEEAAAQGLVAGLNAARCARGEEGVVFGREASYIGVLMDDLVTKTPVEPYRMFTSRAEHRLTLRADNAADRLTGLARGWGLMPERAGLVGVLSRARRALFERRQAALLALRGQMAAGRVDGVPLVEALRRPEFSVEDLARALGPGPGGPGLGGPWVAPFAARPEREALFTAHTEAFYGPYAEKAARAAERVGELEHRPIPAGFDYAGVVSLRSEARRALMHFRPRTLGQAGRLEGVTPADVTLLAVLVRKHREEQRAAGGRPV